MYIVSKFHDYYDTAMIYGIDKECVFRRETKEIEANIINLPYERDRVYVSKQITVDIEPVLIGFCGKIYPTIRVHYHSNYTYSLSEKDDYFFDLSSARAELIKLGCFEDRGRYWGDHYLDSEVGLSGFFNKDYRELDELFREHNSPIFIIERSGYSKNKLVINPNLKNLQFMRFKDPASTFQEIYQYIAGVLGNKEADMVRISDKDMLKQKGFDDFSFKTMKGDKKPRRKNRGKNG